MVGWSLLNTLTKPQKLRWACAEGNVELSHFDYGFGLAQKGQKVANVPDLSILSKPHPCDCPIAFPRTLGFHAIGLWLLPLAQQHIVDIGKRPCHEVSQIKICYFNLFEQYCCCLYLVSGCCDFIKSVKHAAFTAWVWQASSLARMPSKVLRNWRNSLRYANPFKSMQFQGLRYLQTGPAGWNLEVWRSCKWSLVFSCPGFVDV